MQMSPRLSSLHAFDHNADSVSENSVTNSLVVGWLVSLETFHIISMSGPEGKKLEIP